jgi:hypothetical protein
MGVYMKYEDELIDMQVLYLIIPLLEKISVLEALEICIRIYVITCIVILGQRY